MRIALVAEVYPPMRSSGAIQMRDLAREFVKQGHDVTFLVPAPMQQEPWTIEDDDGVIVVRLNAFKTRDMSYLRRAMGEFFTSYAMLWNFRKSPVSETSFDGVAWYSPNIFLGPLVKSLKKKNGCRGYLILRDIFPQWAADIGIIGRGLPYRILDAVANYQYSVADVIGVQTPGNLSYFTDCIQQKGKKVEVLQNWLGAHENTNCSIDISVTNLAGRKIFVYAGNMGVAQGMDKMLNCARALKNDNRIGFVFVGRGSEAGALREKAEKGALTNILFFDEIDPDEIPGLYAQCSVGLVALDARHKTHNIPGKFISYMHSGLPVLASINRGNDLAALVKEARVGRVSVESDGNDLSDLVLNMLDNELKDDDITSRCTSLANRQFSAEAAANQIAGNLT